MENNFLSENSFIYNNRASRSTYRKSDAARFGSGFTPVLERIQGGRQPYPAYFQIIFLNRSHEVIKTFHSLQENMQHARLVYTADGGLKSAVFSVLFNQSIPSYNDMLVQFRTGNFGLGTVFSQSINLKDGVLTIEGTSVFNRLANSLKLTGNVTKKTLKDTVLYYLNLIHTALLAQDEPPFFSINPDKVQVEDTLIIDALFFIDKKPLDILQGLANVAGGKVVYGVDDSFEFYFIDQKKLPTKRCVVDQSAFNVRLSVQDSSIINQVKLFSQRQNGEELGLIALYDDADSQAEYGIKSAEVNLPFFVNAEQAEAYARLFAMPQPLLVGELSLNEFKDNITLGRWKVVQSLNEPVRLLANSCKNLERLPSQNLQAHKVRTGHVTGRFAYQFSGNGILKIEAVIPSCEQVLVSLRNTQTLFFEWNERGQVRTQTVGMSSVVRQVKLATCAVDDGITVRVAGMALLDSVHFVNAFVRQDEGFYTGHEVILKGDSSAVTVQIGRNDQHLVALTKQLQTNARQLDDLLKRA